MFIKYNLLIKINQDNNNLNLIQILKMIILCDIIYTTKIKLNKDLYYVILEDNKHFKMKQDID